MNLDMWAHKSDLLVRGSWHHAPGMAPGSRRIRRAVNTCDFAPKLARTPHPLAPLYPPLGINGPACRSLQSCACSRPSQPWCAACKCTPPPGIGRAGSLQKPAGMIGPVTINFNPTHGCRHDWASDEPGNQTQSEALRDAITGELSRPHLHDLGLGRHDKRAVLHDGLFEWSAREEHK